RHSGFCQNPAPPSQGFPAIPAGRGFPGRIAALVNLKMARHSLRSPPCSPAWKDSRRAVQSYSEAPSVQRQKRPAMQAVFYGSDADYIAMSFSFFSGSTFTLVLAGLAATSIVSPGRKGLGTPLRAFCAGFFTVLIFSR